MKDLPVITFAFSAGMLASINPCGFAMLPAFLAYHVAGEHGAPEADDISRTLNSLRLSLLATLGFVGVFLAAGVLLTLGGRGLITITPWAGLAIGALLVALGVWTLVSKRSFRLNLPGPAWDYTSRSPRNMVLFGIAYATASLGCTLPVFLAMAGSALAMQSYVSGLLVFLSYGVGMGVVLAAVAVGAALFRDAVSRYIRRILPYVHMVSALALIGAGLYLVYYQISVSPIVRGGLP